MKQNLLYHCWLPILLLAGCTDGISPSPQAEDTLQVEAEIQGTAARAVSLSDYDKNTFVQGDQIIIQASNNSSNSYTYTKGTKYWTSTGPCTIGSDVTFTGYYPSATATVASDQTTALGFHDSNQLKTPAVTPTANTLRFTGENAFTPQQAKISIVIRYAQTATPVSATITNAGSSNINSESKETKCLYTTSANKESTALQNWACILLPGTHTLSFAIERTESGASKTGTFTDTERTFIAGNNYTYNFLSTSELVLTGVTVTPFQEPDKEEETGSAT